MTLVNESTHVSSGHSITQSRSSFRSSTPKETLTETVISSPSQISSFQELITSALSLAVSSLHISITQASYSENSRSTNGRESLTTSYMQKISTLKSDAKSSTESLLHTPSLMTSSLVDYSISTTSSYNNLLSSSVKKRQVEMSHLK